MSTIGRTTRQAAGPLLLVFLLLSLLPAGRTVTRKVAAVGKADLLLQRTDAGDRVLKVGPSAGGTALLPGDLLVLVDGAPPAAIEKPLTFLGRQGARLTVFREGKLLDLVSVPAPAPWDVRYLFFVAVGLAFWAAALAALAASRKAAQPAAHLLFAGFAASLWPVLALTPVGPFDGAFRLAVVLEDLGRALFPAFLLTFVLTFPRRARGFHRGLVFLPSAALVALQAFIYLRRYDGPERGELAAVHALDVVQSLWIAFAALAATLYLARLSLQRTDLIAEKRVRLLLFGAGLALLPVGLLNLVPFAFGGSIPVLSTASVLPLALLPVSFWAALSSYRLWDVEVFAREIAAVLVAALLGTALFASAQVAAAHPIPREIPYARGTLELLAGLLIALGFGPVKRGLSAAFARLQYGEAWSDRQDVLALVRELTAPRRLEEITELLEARVSRGLGASPAALLAPIGDGLLDATRVDGGDALRLDELPPEALARTSRLSRLAFSAHPTSAVARLRRAGFRTAAPLSVSGRLLGVFVLGDRAGRVPLSSDDLALLDTLLSPAALALDHARLYRELERQAERYRTLKEFHEDVVSGSAAAIAATDELGRFASVNPAFARQVGIDAAALVGLHAAEVLPPAVRGPDGARRLEADLGQGVRVFDLAVSPFPGAPEGSPAKVYVLHDVTESVKMEKALADRERLAALSTLSAGVAHEVNTPLTGVASFARLLLDETAPEDPRRPLVEKIERQAFRAARLVGSLLDLARGRPRDLAALDPADMAREAVRAVHDEPAARGAALALDVEPSLNGARVAGHADALVQVLVNLLKNALEAVAAREDGRVGLRLCKDARGVIFEVHDNGPGLAAEEVANVFKPFYSTKSAHGGVGLGLAIAGDIIRAHGGALDVDSAPGRGSRFSVVLPALT